ncbi:MAG: endonuclease/exonuclease/phosphatase family protein [Bdellovibrionales bacterium]|nr:endonuclease/exonuclease/phosphatase family protein [Bdellovibrionales bacterium]
MKGIASIFLSLVFSLQIHASWYADIPSDDEVITYHGQSKAEKLQKNTEYTMLVWNIYKHKKQGLVEDLLELSEHSDLVLLQESMVDPTMVSLFQTTVGMGWISAASFFTGDGTTGVATGTRLDVSSAGFIRSKVTEPIVGTPKMVVYTKHPVQSGEELLVANIHGINFVSTRSFKAQIEQLYQTVKGHSGPLIVAGDFNSRNKERWTVLNDFSKQLSLKHVKLKNEKYEHPIDAILTRDVEVMEGEILFDYETSDHKPLLLKFKL